MEVREAAPKAFGHCPFSDCTPRPALKRALWGTSSRKKVPQTIRARVQTPKIKQILPKKVAPNHPAKG